MFWDLYEEYHGTPKDQFDEDFRELFMGMTKYHPHKRFSI